MGFFRPSRTARAGPWFEWKVRIFLLGAALGLAGIFLDDRRLVVAAVVVLAAGVVLRALPVGEQATADAFADDEDDEEDEGDEGDDEDGEDGEDGTDRAVGERTPEETRGEPRRPGET